MLHQKLIKVSSSYVLEQGVELVRALEGQMPNNNDKEEDSEAENLGLLAVILTSAFNLGSHELRCSRNDIDFVNVADAGQPKARQLRV